LDPDNLPARLWLAQIYLMDRLPEPALGALRDPLAHPEKFSLVETNETELNVLAAGTYFQETNFTRAAELLNAEIARHPANDALLTAAARAYMMHGMFKQALGVVDTRLKSAPDDPSWLYGKGLVCIQLKDYDDAIAVLSRVLSIQTNNPAVMFSRAVANLDSDHLDAARADYLSLQQNFSNSTQVAYGLGEIAWRQHDTNEAIHNYEIYIANASTNGGEAQTILERLRQLKK
jgi:tetratricopeptide (TPR) repeat protein